MSELRVVARLSPKTSLVFKGSMMPSSHNLKEERVKIIQNSHLGIKHTTCVNLVYVQRYTRLTLKIRSYFQETEMFHPSTKSSFILQTRLELLPFWPQNCSFINSIIYDKLPHSYFSWGLIYNSEVPENIRGQEEGGKTREVNSRRGKFTRKSWG